MATNMSRRRRFHDRIDDDVIPTKPTLDDDSPIRWKKRSHMGQLNIQVRLKTASFLGSVSRLQLALLLVGGLAFVALQMGLVSFLPTGTDPYRTTETPNLVVPVAVSNHDHEWNGFFKPEGLYRTRAKDYGGLEFESLSNASPDEFIRHLSPMMSYEHHFHRHHHDDEEEDEEEEPECKPVEWRSDIFTNCNKFHELRLDGRFLGRGTFRDAWLLYPNGPDEPSAVLKVLQVMYDDQDSHRVNLDSVEQVRRDAIIMERLTGSPRIVDIFGYCAVSILSEPMPGEVVYEIVPGEGHPEKGKEVPLCANELTAEEKLDIALVMSEAIADLHGFEGGIIVHSDIHPEQWLRSPDGKAIKLNDFNNAEILDWNAHEEHFCELPREAWNGMYRSPEEFLGTPIDEKIDVFCMGHNIYTLLTGLWPYYDEWNYDIIQDRVRAGELPFVDPRIPQQGFIHARLVEIMRRMWAFESEDRPDIFAVVKFLKETKEFAERVAESEAAAKQQEAHRGLRSAVDSKQ